MIPSWPAGRLGDALSDLARKSGLPVAETEAPRPPSTLGDHPELQGEWIAAAAARLGLEVDRVECGYADLESRLRSAGPALLRLVDGSYAALLENGRLLGPDLSVRRVSLAALTAALVQQSEGEQSAADVLGKEARLSPRRSRRVRAAILREGLRDTRVGPIWTVRTPPGTGAWSVARRAGLPRTIVLLMAAHAAESVLWIGSWWLVGKGALEGRFDPGWLLAWALLLLTMVPLRAATGWLQGVAALTGGGLLKERLLVGALRLEPDEVRKEGAGHLLGRVIESEALESLALSGGFHSLIAAVELVVAAAVLLQGAGGVAQALLLAIWGGFAAALARRYYQANLNWTNERLEMTHDLVERMAGHRTRVAQESRAQWHDREDEALNRFLMAGRTMDNREAWLVALIPRGWLIVGLLALAPAFVNRSGSPAELAIGIGGMLLGWRALKGLTIGVWNLAGAAIAWRLVKPLFAAASRPQAAGAPEHVVSTAHAGNNLVEAQDISFRYEGRSEAVLRGCSIRLAAGDRLVLEGPSGCGKSTFGSLLSGLREPDSGLLLAGGLDRRTLGADGWRRAVACAPQFHENHVICGPFAFNLLMGRRGALGQEQVDEAEEICRELGLGDLLERMPGGMMQMVGETGWQLSHGERSRLFMARALLQQSDTIVLDESFAALDPENLRLALRCVVKRARAVLVVAHQ